MAYKKAELKNATWISSDETCVSPFIFQKLTYNKGEKAVVTVGCCGMFELYVNQKKVGDDLFLPLNSYFHEKKDMTYEGIPFLEELGHRIYCPVFNISDYLTEGDNILCFHLGTGWYELPYYYNYGKAKICWNIEITDEIGNRRDVSSNGSEEYTESYVKKSNLIIGETHDYTLFHEAVLMGEGDNKKPVVVQETPDTPFYHSDCPFDKVIRTIQPKKISGHIYDVGENITGYPLILLKKGHTVRIRYGELLDENGNLKEENVYGQYTEYIAGDEDRVVFPKFTWFCFRYFEITGDATVECVNVIHSDVKIASTFHCDNEILNWIYDAYLRTQLNNMHCGIPSDCPHTERRGYTGDGQLTCKAAMMTLDALQFYRKWIYDISDCQDSITGHVQYTAPFIQSGGGPGGWGCAIVVVPYEYYKASGDIEILKELYPGMLMWFSFMEEHSEHHLVVSDREKVWCLGDWCVPAQNVFNMLDAMKIPAPFVNTYFYIKSMELVLKIGEIIGNHENDELLKERISIKKKALTDAYFDETTGDFAENEQGSNAFAVDLGLGDERTFRNLVTKYQATKQYDTGIFGTDILTRVLFEKGEAELTYRLLTSREEVSFYRQMQTGATTLMEYWNGVRSQCHPMYGAVSTYLFEYVLGIRQRENSSAYDEIIIEPACMAFIKQANGSITTPKGVISVSYDETRIDVFVPDGVNAILKINGQETVLPQGNFQLYL